jgi:hypothetical protein
MPLATLRSINRYQRTNERSIDQTTNPDFVSLHYVLLELLVDLLTTAYEYMSGVGIERAVLISIPRPQTTTTRAL